MAQLSTSRGVPAAQKDDAPAKWRRRSLVRVRRPGLGSDDFAVPAAAG